MMARLTKAEHTPLPWRKGFGRTHKESYIDIYGANYRPIAKLIVTDENRAEQDANADLIFSLIDLAKNVGGFDDGVLQSADLNVLRAALREYRDQARAALSTPHPDTAVSP